MARMEAPDVAFMVHSVDSTDDEGRSNKGSKITQVDNGPQPPEWPLRDFGFAAYNCRTAAPGLREVHFGRRTVWAFASPREHCEEIVVFRRGSDTRRKWDGEAVHEPKVGLDMFFIMRMRQVTEETPFSKQFNGQWSFWESLFAPILDDQQNMEVFCKMEPHDRCVYFAPKKLPVTCHRCPAGHKVLSIPEDMVVKYTLQVCCTEMEAWSGFCKNIGEDMVLQLPCILQDQPLKAGSECIKANSEIDGLLEGSRLKKRDMELLKLPVQLTFRSEMNVSAEWRPDVTYLRKKFEILGQAYDTNLMNGFSSLGRTRPDPWHPMARLAINALNKVLSRYPGIRSILDIGCGDMAWMQYFIQDHPEISYVGVDVLPYCLAVNFRRFPKMQFIQTDLSNFSGVEVIPEGCDLVIAKDVFNHMVLPDAVDALKRVINTRPRFLLTHIHKSSDNSGWETRMNQHLEWTPYNYNKIPFSLPYPMMDVQRISDETAFVLYQVVPDERPGAPPPRIEDLAIPAVGEDLQAFVTVSEGEWTDPVQHSLPAPGSKLAKADNEFMSPDELGPRPAPEGRTTAGEALAAERKPIKGIPAAEFRARCDLIFEKFDKDKDDVLNFEELVALMDAGGRQIEGYDAYAGLCGRLGCDARLGLTRRDVYKLFEKAPQVVWEEVYRSINPIAQMVKKGAERLPETFLERPLPNFIFDDSDQTAKVIIDFNEHLYFGAAQIVTREHVQAYFGKQRVEVHIVAPGSHGARDLFLWKFVVTPLTAEIVPEDCALEFRDVAERAGIKGQKLVVKLTKSKKKHWGKVGQAVTGQRI